MKVSIQQAERDRKRALGMLEFIPNGDAHARTFVLPDTPVSVDGNGSLVLHSAYSPETRRLSVFVDYHSADVPLRVFIGMTNWIASPHFAFRLPTGQFIELFFSHASPHPEEKDTSYDKPTA